MKAEVSFDIKNTTTKMLGQVGLGIGAIFMLIPFLWMFSTSFKVPAEVLSWPPKLFPQHPTVQNYVDLFKQIPFTRYFYNSVLISSISTISIYLTSVIGGFVFG